MSCRWGRSSPRFHVSSYSDLPTCLCISIVGVAGFDQMMACAFEQQAVLLFHLLLVCTSPVIGLAASQLHPESCCASVRTEDWEDIKFGVENDVDFYAVSFVKDAKFIHELKDYLKSANADIHEIPKIESVDCIPYLQSIIAASDGAMVARGDLGAELPTEDVPLIQAEIVRTCRSMEKPVIVATNMLESMINHPTPTRAEVSDIAIAVREDTDAIMLSGETTHGKFDEQNLMNGAAKVGICG